MTFEQVEIPPDAPVVGQRVSEIVLPEECLIVSVRRGRKLYIAHGDTLLHAGDQVTVFANNTCLPQAHQRLVGARPATG